MLRHALFALILSIIILVFLPQWQNMIHLLHQAQIGLINYIAKLLTLRHGGWLISRSLALMLLPLAIIFIPFIIFAILRRPMPYIGIIFWTLWIMLITLIGMP